METKKEVVVKKLPSRKAIFVNDKVFAKFKKVSEKEGRKYSSMLEVLLEGR